MNTYLEEYICESMGNHNFFLPSLFLLPRSHSLLEFWKIYRPACQLWNRYLAQRLLEFTVSEYQRRQLFPRCAPGVARLSKLHWHVYQNAVSKEQHCSRFFQSIRYCGAILCITYKYSNTIFVEFENKIFIPLIRYLINVRAKNIRTSNSNHELINRIFFKLYNVNLR